MTTPCIRDRKNIGPRGGRCHSERTPCCLYDQCPLVSKPLTASFAIGIIKTETRVRNLLVKIYNLLVKK